MPTPPLQPPAERFAIVLSCLSKAVMARTGWSLTLQLISQIVERIRGIKQRFRRIAAQLQAGTYVPRESGRRRSPSVRKPRQPNKLPHQAGWFLKLLPEAMGLRSQLDSLLRDPEMVALLEAAPTAMRRAIRSICHMLRIPPPEILALPHHAPKRGPASSRPAGRGWATPPRRLAASSDPCQARHPIPRQGNVARSRPLPLR